jgi:hypothetical protein
MSVARLAGAIALLAAWLGAALLLAAVVAPASFAALPSRALAGAVVGRVLPAVFIAGIVACAAAALLGHVPGASFGRARLAMLALGAAANAFAQFGIAPRIARLRAEIGPSLDALAVDDVRRAAFGRLHAFSVAWMGAAMLAVGVALVLHFIALGRGAAHD